MQKRTVVGKVGEEEVNYAEEDSDGEDEGEKEVNDAEEDSDGEDEGRRM